MLPIIFHPEVKPEISHSFRWYQEQSLGLGNEFLQELEDSLHSIQSLPYAWPKMGQFHRRFVMNRFPYSIVYQVYEESKIFIVAVMHNHRKPGYWSERG